MTNDAEKGMISRARMLFPDADKAPFPVTFELAQKLLRTQIKELEKQEAELEPEYTAMTAHMAELVDEAESLARRARAANRTADEAVSKSEYEAAVMRRDALRRSARAAREELRLFSRDTDAQRTRFRQLQRERERIERQLGDHGPWRSQVYAHGMSGIPPAAGEGRTTVVDLTNQTRSWPLV